MNHPVLFRNVSRLSQQANQESQNRHGTSRPVFRAFSGCTAVLFVLATVLAAGCNQAPARAPDKKTTEVVVTTPVTSEVTDFQDFTGRLDALKSIEIRARVSGFVLSAPFKEGDLVHEGDLLFQIDPQSYQADLNLAAANLKLAKADQNLQQKNAARARVMMASRSMAQEDYDTAVAAAEKSKASVEAMDAAKNRAQLYLDWTRVTAPITGRVSRRFIDPGNLVMADNTILTSLVRDDQLYAYFDIDEHTYLDLIGPIAAGQGSWLSMLQFPVLMQLANEERFTRSGVVNFIDNRVSATTGTMRMRAIFDNSSAALRAGLFVRVRFPIGSRYKAILIPAEALLSDQGRHYVFVVNDKNEVVYRPVTLGQEIHGLRVIKQGVALGDRVIVSGLQRVRQGSQVQVKMQDPPKPPKSPMGELSAAPAKAADTGIKGEKESGKKPAGVGQPPA